MTESRENQENEDERNIFNISPQKIFEYLIDSTRKKERKQIGEWLEKQINEKTSSDELADLLLRTMQCLNRGVFPE